jgi:serine/threonine protein kinase
MGDDRPSMTDATRSAPPPDVLHTDALPVGTRLGEFEILALLGVGGFGMVYRAFDHSLRRSVAIKEYMPSALAGRAQGQSLWVRTSSDEQTFQAGLASFVSEARLLAQFDHPSLVKVFRFWEANNTAYMVMPLYVGMTFKQARAQMSAPPSEAWLRKVLWSVLSALRVLHGSQTLHRDISPDNIFLQDAGPPVLLDLGAARHAISDNERQHTAVLKVNYAPIEQYADGAGGDAGLPQGPWSDLYSLAAVVYGCLCNDTPLPATLRSIRDRMVRFPRVAKTVRRQFGVEYSPPFVAAIAQALELQPAKRPQSIDEFLAIMEMTSAPEGLQHFDWRAELGTAWMPTAAAAPQDAAAQDAGEDSETPTRFMEPPPGALPVDVEIGAPAPPLPPSPPSLPPAGPEAVPPVPPAAPAHRKPHPPARQRHPWAWGGGAAVLAGVAIAGWWGLRAPATPPQSAREEIIIEEAEPPEAVAAAQTPVQTASMALAPAEAASAVAPAASHPAPARRAAPRAKPPEPVVAAAPEKPAPAPEPAPAPPPKPKPAPPPAPSPLDACASANFVTRPMCIYQECQKPALAAHPVCVENRRHYEAEEQRRRAYSQ